MGIYISLNDIFHLGLHAKIRLFIHVPDGIYVAKYDDSNTTGIHSSPHVKLLILSTYQCAELECNKQTEQSEFVSSYVSPFYPVENPEFLRSGVIPGLTAWQTIDGNKNIVKIRITPQHVCITKDEFNNLLETIKQEQKTSQTINSKQNSGYTATKHLEEERQTKINEICYPFNEALKIVQEKIPGFTETDLLRHGYFEAISLIFPYPLTGHCIAFSSTDNIIHSMQSFDPPPNLLKLSPSDCYRIEIYKKITCHEFRIGFKTENNTLVPCIPPPISNIYQEHDQHLKDYFGSKNLPNFNRKTLNKKLSWCVVGIEENNRKIQFEIRTDDLYITKSDLHRLIETEPIKKRHHPSKSEHYPRFTIANHIRLFLAPNEFPTLEEAADQLGHPINSLLIAAAQGLIELITPIPCEVSLCLTKKSAENDRQPLAPEDPISLPQEHIPDITILSKIDCESLAKHGSHKNGNFNEGYLINGSPLSHCTPYYYKNESSKPVSTSDTKIRGIWKTYYIEKPIELDLTIGRIHLDLAKTRKLITENPQIFESFDKSESGISENADQTLHQCLNEEISFKDALDHLDISRATFYKIIDGKYPSAPPSFPPKIKGDNGRVFFNKKGFEAWLNANHRLIKSSISAHPKRSEKSRKSGKEPKA